ncbi:MAG: hypothetical protein ACFFE2_15800 [Candidatus Thorarchaeota archaeon]
MEDRFPKINTEKLREFMRKLCSKSPVEKTKLAKSLGYKNSAAIANHLSTAQNLNLINTENSEVSITSRGREFCNETNQGRIISDFLMDEKDGLGHLTNCIRTEGTQIDNQVIVSCIQLFVEEERNAKSLAGTVIDWYEFAGFIYRRDKEFQSVLPATSLVHNLTSWYSEKGLDLSLYLDLTSAEFISASSQNPLSHSQLMKCYNDFKTASPDKAEAPMLEFISRVFRILGFHSQYKNGPRKNTEPPLGSTGDDLMVIIPTTGQAASQQIGGLAFACELKRSHASKKAVSQSVTFMNQILEKYPSFLVLPLVISDGDRYVNDIAQSYALSSMVVHFPLEFFKCIIDEQMKRYQKGSSLLTSLDFIRLVIELHSVKKIEPRLSDLMQRIANT